jgi:biotin transporter BioY
MHVITIMCDSWTGPTGMIIMNFIVYCNGIMFFHKFIDCTGHNQDVDFVYGVSIMLPNCLIVMFLLIVCISCVDRKSKKLLSSLVQAYCADRN